MIHATAIIDPKAKLADDVQVGPYTVIGPDVEIDSGTWIGPHVVIRGRTKIGKNNKIYQFASVGEDPQHLAYKGEDTYLEIGDNNIIREFCSLHRGTGDGRGYTKIGNNNLLMAYVHIAHDCILGNGIVLANNVTLAGHVVIDDRVISGGFVVISQFCRIGAYAFIVGTTPINKDVLPYTLISSHDPSKRRSVLGLNLIGLRRNKFSNKTIANLKTAYHIIYQEDLTTEQALPKLEEMVADCPEVQLLIDFLKESSRGILR